MTTDTTRDIRHGNRLAMIVATIPLAAVAILPSALFSIAACVGSEGAGVRIGSIRGQVCSIPGMGPWPYPIVVAILATGWTVLGLVRGTVGRIAVLVPAGIVMLVPVVLAFLPRTGS